MRPLIIVGAALSTLLASQALADASGSGWTFSLMAGSTLLDDDIDVDDDLLVGGRIGYKIGSYFQLEGMFHSMSAPSGPVADGEVRFDHIGADLILNPIPGGFIEPYLAGGYARTEWRIGGGGHDFDGFELGGGVRIRLAEGDGFRWDLRLDGRDVLAKLDQTLVDASVKDETHGNLLLTAGLQLSFRASDTDTDGDGVVDKKDECAGTPLGAIVDSRGCPSDTDGDGVYDGLDRCPGTSPRAKTDARGCPIDSDGDGVYDGLDRCNNTPISVPVDSKGCTKDTDGDGVHDGIDRCPRTKRGVEIDSKGCEVTEVEREMLDTGMIRLDSIFFESGKAILKPESFPSLDEVGRVLEKWSALRIEIAGHTDSQGGAALNKKLSKSRADSVRDYLTTSFAGIDAKQLETAGFGEAKPIANNGTKDGRARNRRVEFKVLNRGVLTQ